jgi:hypothetical protein
MSQRQPQFHHRAAGFVIALGFLIGAAILIAPIANAADITVDDAVTSGANYFTYTGSSWTSCGGCNSTATNNSYRYAYTTGNKAVLTFTGTQATIYGFKELNPPGVSGGCLKR